MAVAIIDTTVIVHLFRRNPAALSWLATLTQRLSVTPITWLEVIEGASGKAAQTKCKAILNEFDMIYLTSTDMDWAIQRLERYRFSHGAGANDCLIASVAYRLQVPLYTHNLKDMRVLIGEQAVKPY